MSHESPSKRSGAEDKNAPPYRHFVADARVVLSLGRDSIKDKTTAVLELVKNSYDAGATAVVIEIKVADADPDNRFLRITDNGHGMTSDDLDDRFLWIGFSVKRASPTYRGRRRIGEKGVGRLSADRLGELLELRTQAKQEPAVGVAIDWTTFDTAKVPIADIQIPEIPTPEFYVPAHWPYLDAENGYWIKRSKTNGPMRTGTELTIRRLRQNWDLAEVEELSRDLSFLTSPFRTETDFQVRLVHDLGESDDEAVIESNVLEAAQVQADFTLAADGTIKYTIKPSEGPAESDTETWELFYQRVKNGKTKSDEDRDKRSPEQPFVGPLRAVLYFYLRQATGDLSALEVRELLNRMAGVKVYRDGIRVMPYGDNRKEEGGDWLGLGERKTADPAGAGRKTFKIAPGQLVGAVFISSDENPHLRDTSAREGLVHDDAFRELKAFTLGCIGRLETHYHQAFVKKKEQAGTEKNPRQAVLDFGEVLKELRSELNSAKTTLPPRSERRIESVAERIASAVSQLESFKQSIDELASQAIIYRGLASIGIASVVFSHETDLSLDLFQASAIAARNNLKFKFTPERLPIAIHEIGKAIEEAKKISAWGKFALLRVKADKRRKRSVDLGRAISDLANDLKEVFSASSIELSCNVGVCQGRAFQMDIESIVLNLLTNAYAFAKLTTTVPRKVQLQAKSVKVGGREGLQICVSDTGPGVPDALHEKIWTPLFSTKEEEKGRSSGTGLGLSIVDDIVKDNNGTRKVDKDPDLSGARFTIWIPLP